jgi:P-type Ca2+ transporter type 2C
VATMSMLSVDPSLLDVAEVHGSLGVDPTSGLSSAEAAERLDRAGPNRLDPTAQVPAWRKLLAQFSDPLIYLLLAAIVVSLVAWAVEGAKGVPFEAAVIAVIVVANAVLGFVQEQKAEQAVAALQRMAAATATVLRDGQEERIPAEEIVPGDILVLGEGDAIGADGRLLQVASLTVAESSLTGESEPVLKDRSTLPAAVPLGDRTNMVFSGTAVTRGRGRAVVTATGMRTEMGRIASLLGRTEEQRTPLQREVDLVGRTLGIAVIVIAVVVVVAILLTSNIQRPSELVQVLLLGVALAVAAVPEGLPAVLSVVLALGVQRMATQRAIVKKLSSVETLGSASVICSDKTGTLTKNEMTIQRVVTRSGEVAVTGIGYRPEGELRVSDQPLSDGPLLEEVRAVLGGGSLAGDAVLRQDGGQWSVQGDPTDAAFLVAERKLMSSIEADAARQGRIAVITKGAPDVLLGRCTRERVATAEEELTEERRTEILAAVDRLVEAALRTLAVAYHPLESTEPPQADESLEQGLVFAGLVGIIDPPRPEAVAAIAEAHGSVPLYARVAPEHKLRIVDALQADGNIVAMTGDGVNDAPALKAADIGVAMGVTGTDVAKEAAKMILADDNFATIVAAVREGRAIFANIRKFLRYLVSSNIGEVLTMLLGVVGASVIGLDAAGGAVVAPLLATQILWINLLTDGAPALAMGVDPPTGDVMRHPPRKLTDRVIDREMQLGVLLVGVVMALATLLTIDLELPGGLVEGSAGLVEARTAGFTVLVLAQLFNCFNSRSERDSAFRGLFRNRLLWAAIGLSLLLQVLVVHLPFLDRAFGTAPLSVSDWALCLAMASLVLWADELKKLIVRRVSPQR